MHMNLSKLQKAAKDIGAWVLQSMRLKRVGHDLATEQQQHQLSVVRVMLHNKLLPARSCQLPDSGIKPAPLMSPALAGEFFTPSATWEARSLILWLEVTIIPWWLRRERINLQWGDLGSIPGLGRSRGGGHGNPLQYSCPENVMDGGAWQATVHGSQRVGHGWVTQHSTAQSPEPADCWEALLQAVVAGGPLSKAGLGWAGLLLAAHWGRHFPCELILTPSLKGGSCLGKALFVAMTAKCKKLHKLHELHKHISSCLCLRHVCYPPTVQSLSLGWARSYTGQDCRVIWWRAQMCSGDGEDLMRIIHSTYICSCNVACKLICGWVHMQFMEVLYE